MSFKLNTNQVMDIQAGFGSVENEKRAILAILKLTLENTHAGRCVPT